jgi:hypothetical protein
MKFFFVLLEAGIFFFFSELIFSKPQNSENDFLFSSTVDSIHSNDSLIVIPPPTFFSNSNLLFGAEILDPLQAKDFFTRVTRLWKTDFRLGLIQPIGNYIKTVFSIRGQDSPETNSIKFYEVFAQVNYNLGNLVFGQQRIQAGNQSKYLNDAFDRTFWDKGLVYDFLFRGIQNKFLFSNSQLDVFVGSDYSSGFIGGTKLSTKITTGFNIEASALYIARDPQYAAFGFQFGLEFKESFKNFSGYHVIAYKTFDQEPARIDEITFFTEEDFSITSNWNIGSVFLYKKMNSLLRFEEIRASINTIYKTTDFFSPSFQVEYFNVYNFYEIHCGFSAYLNYTEHIRIVPRIRYIATEFGPDIGFVGIEGRIIF